MTNNTKSLFMERLLISQRYSEICQRKKKRNNIRMQKVDDLRNSGL